MIKIKSSLILFMLALSWGNPCFSKDKADKSNTWWETPLKDDLLKSIKIIFKSSYMQFSRPTSWAILGGGGLALWPIFNGDKKYLNKYSRNKPNSFLTFYGGTVSNVFNFPIIPITTYLMAKKSRNRKLYDFSIEYTACLYLALAEAGILSIVPVHKRPNGDEDLNFWEKAFRFESSFPSGHTIGFATLTFKVFQYYGPLYAIIPLASTIIASFERVKSQKHYPSDVVGSLLVSLLASEGTRIVYNKPKHYHGIYKFIFDHQVTMQFRSEQKNYFVGLNMTY